MALKKSISGLSMLIAAAWLLAVMPFLKAKAEEAQASNSGRAAIYVRPTGPQLSPRQAEQIAVREARRAQEPGAIKVTVARGPFLAAQAVTEGQSPASARMPPGASPETREWFSSKAYLVVMQGHRFAPSVPVPRGRKGPSGSVMVVILDSHTGFREGLSIGKRVPKARELSPVVSFSVASEAPRKSPTLNAAGRRRSFRGEILGHIYLDGGPRVDRTGPHPAANGSDPAASLLSEKQG